LRDAGTVSGGGNSEKWAPRRTNRSCNGEMSWKAGQKTGEGRMQMRSDDDPGGVDIPSAGGGGKAREQEQSVKMKTDGIGKTIR